MELQKYQVTRPDGQVMNISGPAGASQEEVVKRAKELYLQQVKDKRPQEPEQSYTAGESAVEGVTNLPASTYNLGEDLFTMLTSPVETAKGVGELIQGISLTDNDPNNTKRLFGSTYREKQQVKWQKEGKDWLTKAKAYKEQGNKKAQLNALKKSLEYSQKFEKLSGTSSRIGEYFKKKYGGWEEIKRTFAEDPASLLLDLSAIFTGGATIVPKLAKIADAINPITQTSNLIKKASTPVSAVVDTLTSGSGVDAVKNAVKAGSKSITAPMSNAYNMLKGNTAKGNPLEGTNSFVKSMRENSGYGLDDMLAKAKGNLTDMKIAKNKQYTSDMAKLSTDKTQLAFDGVVQALKSAKESFGMSRSGVVKNEEVMNLLRRMEDKIDEFRKQGARSPADFDDMKQSLQGMFDPRSSDSQILTAGSSVVRAVGDDIAKQAPAYRKTMADYGEASTLVKEIEKSLSLNNRASADTAIRKLTSVMRNNVNTNYGARGNLAKMLSDSGRSVDVLERITGSAFSSYMPKGLRGVGAGLGGTGGVAMGVVSVPTVMALLATQSPRIIGELLYKIGQGGAIPAKLLNLLSQNPKFTKVVAPYLNNQNQYQEEQQSLLQ
jgi:hypothetical protein